MIFSHLLYHLSYLGSSEHILAAPSKPDKLVDGFKKLLKKYKIHFCKKLAYKSLKTLIYYIHYMIVLANRKYFTHKNISLSFTRKHLLHRACEIVRYRPALRQHGQARKPGGNAESALRRGRLQRCDLLCAGQAGGRAERRDPRGRWLPKLLRGPRRHRVFRDDELL